MSEPLSDVVRRLMVSFPAPPVILSSPEPAEIVSFPANPLMVSLPSPPLIISFPVVPMIVSLEWVPEATKEKLGGKEKNPKSRVFIFFCLTV